MEQITKVTPFNSKNNIVKCFECGKKLVCVDVSYDTYQKNSSLVYLCKNKCINIPYVCIVKCMTNHNSLKDLINEDDHQESTQSKEGSTQSKEGSKDDILSVVKELTNTTVKLHESYVSRDHSTFWKHFASKMELHDKLDKLYANLKSSDKDIETMASNLGDQTQQTNQQQGTQVELIQTKESDQIQPDQQQGTQVEPIQTKESDQQELKTDDDYQQETDDRSFKILNLGKLEKCNKSLFFKIAEITKFITKHDANADDTMFDEYRMKRIKYFEKLYKEIDMKQISKFLNETLSNTVLCNMSEDVNLSPENSLVKLLLNITEAETNMENNAMKEDKSIFWFYYIRKMELYDELYNRFDLTSFDKFCEQINTQLAIEQSLVGSKVKDIEEDTLTSNTNNTDTSNTDTNNTPHSGGGKNVLSDIESLNLESPPQDK